ncbi:putative cofD-like protein [Arcanobacterium wilhelmae]|uniref:Putative gluconeogenesis factor n=1 Tax=Arcanobacterium wilhelmae TaxID=1803177 RepID=A0ABT9N8G4_9ACTO|nr:uridine diphosphate-N-acetylglucosamine-binding protein YvcK [Arcanobacterium wilhelmae]MDP9799989.1 putative cofD-like protein [Arcanobacterium wilhelmae]WFN89489.1 uridine diphosphate-N-acetylglucosamine-binding protein YvcK [Arcanobacterium wilhelmae]
MRDIGYAGRRVVAFGGGHGLYATLSALRILTRNITAIVTVADDGGSSGRLRNEMEILPPGDLRMALSALCDDSQWGLTWRSVLQHRFTTSGELNGHSLGNLLIAAIWQEIGDPVAGLDLVGQLLTTHGRVLPMSAVPLSLTAHIERDGVVETVHGQSVIAKLGEAISQVSLSPANPPARPEALRAIDEADWVIFGPGSWYTSVIPHLLVPELRGAVAHTAAKRMLVVNLAPDLETRAMSSADLVRSFHAHAPDMALDIVLVDPSVVGDHADLREAVRRCGAELLVWPVKRDVAKHDPLTLAAALREAFETA